MRSKGGEASRSRMRNRSHATGTGRNEREVTIMSQPAASASAEYTPRARLAALVARAELNPDTIGVEVRANPQRALEDAGFTEAEAQQLLAPSAADVDPREGVLAAAGGGCSDTTCGLSLCPGTCFVTVPAIPGLCKTCTF